MPGFTDEQLIEIYINGDTSALGIIYNRYSRKVYNKCWSFVRDYDEAYDLAQDILLKAIEKIDSFKGDARFSTWLYSIAYNHCVENFRRKSRFLTTEISGHFDLASDEPGYEEIIEMEKKRNDLICMLDEISGTDKELLLMKYQMGYSLKELQDIFNLGSSAVKMRLLRARQKVESLFACRYDMAAAG
ncbi:MAG: sigma-70 family RNA polymerase sigma factor [Bacteroidetes bacterium]|nr:sigma-70 family RNA polymerase sigma factor [Bacteroidota bacterium]